MMKRKRNYLILFISGWIYFVATRDRMPIRSDLIHLSSITRCLCPILLQAPILYLCRLIYPFHSPRLLIFRCHRCQLLGHLLRSRWFPTFPDQASHWKICFDLLAWRMMSRIGNQIFLSHLMFTLVFDSVVPPSNHQTQRILGFLALKEHVSFSFIHFSTFVKHCMYRDAACTALFVPTVVNNGWCCRLCDEPSADLVCASSIWSIRGIGASRPIFPRCH